MTYPASFSVNRVVRGSIQTASYPVASGVPIAVGDHTVFFSGNLYPVSAFGALISWNSGNELQNWSGGRAVYAGISLGDHSATSLVSGSITVAYTGVAESPIQAASGTTYAPGQFVGFSQGLTSGVFNPQTVMVCSGQATGIGKIIQPVTANFSGAGFASGQTTGFGVNVIKYTFQGFLQEGALAN